MHYLMIVAALCQMDGYTNNAMWQAECQAYYVKCVKDKPASLKNEEMLESCVMKRLSDFKAEPRLTDKAVTK